MKRNPRLPDHLRDEKKAIEWWLENEKDHANVPLPYELMSYDGVLALAGRDIEEAEAEDYDLFEQIVKANEVLERTDFYVGFMLEAEEKDAVELYRSISVRDRRYIRRKGVGVFWSYEYHCAQSHWGSAVLPDFVLTGVVRPENIDWEGGYAAFIEFGEEECEVRVDEGAPILITEINGQELDDPIEATA